MKTLDLYADIDAALQLAESGRVGEASAIGDRLLRQAPRAAEPRALRGVLLARAGNWQAATVALSAVGANTVLHPGLSLAIARSWLAHGAPERAAACLSESMRLLPADPRPRVLFGNALRMLGRIGEAQSHYRQVLTEQPGYVEALVALAFLLREEGHFDEAAESLRSLLAHHPSDADAHRRCAHFMIEMRRFDEAVPILRRAAELDPQHSGCHQTLAGAYLRMGDFAAAARHFVRAIELDPDAAGAYLGLVHTRRFDGPEPDLCTRLHAAADDARRSAQTRSCAHFALGKIADDQGDYAQAFREFEQANAARRAAQPFDRAAWEALHLSMRATVTRALLAAAPVGTGQKPEPVFVVGMVRSGTTLVDRIISGHPAAVSAGELPHIDQFAKTLPQMLGDGAYPQCLAALDPQHSAALAAIYRRHLGAFGGQAALVVDKNPLNYRHLGLITLLFPRARIVHCRRSAPDTCLSAYQQNFAHDDLAFTYDLQDLGRCYQDYLRLMAHWRTVLPRPMYELQYEDLVADPEGEARRLIGFLELAWDARCLEPHARQGAIVTASLWQARQPFYGSSVGRHRHYAQQLQPLLATLGEDA